jgi:histidyl-tRNA synthetase
MKSSKGLRGGTNDSYFQGEKVLREIFNHVCRALEMASGNCIDDPVLLPKTRIFGIRTG